MNPLTNHSSQRQKKQIRKKCQERGGSLRLNLIALRLLCSEKQFLQRAKPARQANQPSVLMPCRLFHGEFIGWRESKLPRNAEPEDRTAFPFTRGFTIV